VQSFCLQDFVTIRGQSSVTSVTQGESAWLDLSGFQDLTIWLDVKEFSVGGGTAVTMTYQTAPTREESLFVGMLATTVTMANGVTISPVLAATATTAVARLVRWKLSVTGTPTSAWDATFRVWIAANAPGQRRGGKGACAGCGPSGSRVSRATIGDGPTTPLHLIPGAVAGSGGLTAVKGGGLTPRFQPTTYGAK
jgi:hypothetical protein